MNRSCFISALASLLCAHTVLGAGKNWTTKQEVDKATDAIGLFCTTVFLIVLLIPVGIGAIAVIGVVVSRIPKPRLAILGFASQVVASALIACCVAVLSANEIKWSIESVLA